MTGQAEGWQRRLGEPLRETVMVALDLETTGLNPRSDRVLEIGAVKFRDREELGRFHTLVDPGVPIPPFVVELTGIKPADIAGAPPMDAVLPELTAFLGSHPMIGHNVGFDAAFIRAAGAPPRLETFDTYDLAYVLLPGASEYNLGGLGKRFGLVHDDPHRALSDALVTRDLFLELMDRLRGLDPSLLAEFNRIAAASGLSTGVLAGRVLDEMEAVSALAGGAMGGLDLRALSSRLRYRPRPKLETLPDLPLDAPGGLDRVVESVFAPGGHLAKNLAGYENRPQQAAMARAVAAAIEKGEHLVVEAGTGVGKSLAYLVPAALRALSGNHTILVSTNTINLQEQLLTKDIPAAEAVLESLGFPAGSLVATQLKGRANYLCVKRWLHARRAAEMTVEEARLLAKTLVWLQDTETGDRGEIRLNRDDYGAFTRMSAQGAAGCPSPEGPCFLRSARAGAHGAHIVIINHSLLMADLVMGGGLLPDHDALIIDEAHHLESVATRNLGFNVEQRQLEADLASLAGDRGLVADVRRALLAEGAGDDTDGDSRELADRAGEALAATREAASEMLRSLRSAVAELTPKRGLVGRDLRVTEATRAQPAWSDLEIAWENFDLAAGRLALALRDLGIAAERAGTKDSVLEAVSLNISGALDALESARSGLRQAIPEPAGDMVYWLTVRQPVPHVTVSGAPLAVGQSLQEQLFDRERCVVLTSGTLAYEHRFDRVREALGVGGGSDLLLGSPFNFQESALVLLPSDMPEPGRPGFNEAVGVAIQEVASALRERTLVLFTSNSALSNARSAVAAPLRAQGVNVVAQGLDGPPHRVMRLLDQAPATVALGTSSLWEGVDLEEESIKALMMARLPFPVPSDPMFAARSELFDDGFGDYAVPEAVQRFRQGFGRLIRSRADRGVFIVLDPRIVTKGYGAAFRDALPDCRIEVVHASNLGSRAKAWLDLDAGGREP